MVVNSNPFGESVINPPIPDHGANFAGRSDPQFFQQAQATIAPDRPSTHDTPQRPPAGSNFNPFESRIDFKPAKPAENGPIRSTGSRLAPVNHPVVSTSHPTANIAEDDLTVRDLMRDLGENKHVFEQQAQRVLSSPSTQTHTSATSNDRSVRYAPGTTVRVVDLWDPNIYTEISAADANEYISILEKAATLLPS